MAALRRELPDGPATVVGTVVRNPPPTGRGALQRGRRAARAAASSGVYAKRLLPTYDVFDEARYFAPGDGPVVVDVAGRRVGLSICEDLWSRDAVDGRRLYDVDPPGDLVRAGAEIVVNLSASPYHAGKDAHRRALFADEAAAHRPPPRRGAARRRRTTTCSSTAAAARFDARGARSPACAAFEEDFAVVDLGRRRRRSPPEAEGEPADELRRALVMGIEGYARKTGFRRAVLGPLRGHRLRRDGLPRGRGARARRTCSASGMPGPYSAAREPRDAELLAKRLGIGFRDGADRAGLRGVPRARWPAHFARRPFDVTEENLQARIRGNVLMALSNKHGHLVLTTGNKSELAVGYCTLYGDMCGGLALISDVWKTRVYEVAARLRARPGDDPAAHDRSRRPRPSCAPTRRTATRCRRTRSSTGSSRVGSRTARPLAEIVATGEDRAVVGRVLRLVERAEYKRRQMAPGLKVTPVAFGTGWRMPIARPTDLSGEA